MIRRGARYGSLAMKVAFERMSAWAQSRFMDPQARLQALAEAEENMGRTMASALSELRGPAAKLGQMMALESGLLPENFRKQLQSLQHSVLPLSYASVRKVLKHSFQMSPEEIFKEFEPEAFAAASLGQVHRAVLASGEKVAVKIQYPGISASISGDFALAQTLFAPLTNNGLLSRTLSDLKLRISEEMDYNRERELQEWFGLKTLPQGLVIPQVFAEYCSPTVLTTGLMEGFPLSSPSARLSQDEKNQVGQSIFDFFVISLFEWHAIHGDAHGGNYLWMPEGKVCALVDFGAAKKDFDPRVLDVFRGFFAPVAPERMLALYESLGADLNGMSTTERHAFYDDVIEPYRSRISRLMAQEAYEFNPEDTVARDLRVQLFSHAFHPRLQSFSGEFTVLHRTLYGVLNLLCEMNCRISTRRTPILTI